MNSVRRNLAITAGLASLGVLADVAGVAGLFGIDAESKITARWLFLETVVMIMAIVFLVQFILDMRKKLDIADANSSELLKQLIDEKKFLQEQLKHTQDQLKLTVYERELLQSAIQVIETDERRLTDPEIAYLSAVSGSMSSGRELLLEEDKFDIIKKTIKLSCADKDFRIEQQVAVKDIGEKYGLSDSFIIGLIGEQKIKLEKNKSI